MRVGFIADVHLGNHRTHGGPSAGGLNRRCREALEAFRSGLAAAAGAGAGCVVVCGDLYDGCRPEPQLIAEVQAALRWGRDALSLRCVIVLGNHDMHSNEDGDHALGPLRDYATVVTSPEVVKMTDGVAPVELLCVPFHPEPASAWFEKTVKHVAKGKSKATRLLVVHLGVADDETPDWLRTAPDSIHVERLQELADAHGIDGVFAGNWHEHLVWEGDDVATVVQCGALVPTGWDNPGFDAYGRVVVADLADAALHYIAVPGPRFATVTGLDGLEATVAKHAKSKCQLYVRVRAMPEDVARIKAFADEHCGDDKVLRACEVVVDSGEAQAAARTAAQSARSADTLGEALGKFVAAMPLKEGVDRGAVLTRAQKYLGVSQ